jgi:hypothetical protein
MKDLAMLQALDMHRLRGTPKGIYVQIGISERGKVGTIIKLIAQDCY